MSFCDPPPSEFTSLKPYVTTHDPGGTTHALTQANAAKQESSRCGGVAARAPPRVSGRASPQAASPLPPAPARRPPSRPMPHLDAWLARGARGARGSQREREGRGHGEAGADRGRLHVDHRSFRAQQTQYPQSRLAIHRRHSSLVTRRMATALQTKAASPHQPIAAPPLDAAPGGEATARPQAVTRGPSIGCPRPRRWRRSRRSRPARSSPSRTPPS